MKLLLIVITTLLMAPSFGLRAEEGGHGTTIVEQSGVENSVLDNVEFNGSGRKTIIILKKQPKPKSEGVCVPSKSECYYTCNRSYQFQYIEKAQECLGTFPDLCICP